MNIDFGKLSHEFQIGEKGKLGIMGIEGGMVSFAVLLVDEVSGSLGDIRQAIIDTFHPPADEEVFVSALPDGSVMCLFKKLFQGQIRDPLGISLSAQRGFVGILEQLRTCQSDPC